MAQNNELKKKIETLSADLETALNKIVTLESDRSNIFKKNLSIQQVINQNRHNKKNSEIDMLTNASDEDIQEMNQLKEKNRTLKHSMRTQTSQIHQLYTQIVNLQEKEDEHEKRIEEYNGLDRRIKSMTKSNSEVKTVW